MNREEIATLFMQLQDRICNNLEAIDGKSRFIEDKWERNEGGGGRSGGSGGGG